MDPSSVDPLLVGHIQELDVSSWAAEEEVHTPFIDLAHIHLPSPSSVESGSLHHYSGHQATLK